MTEAITAYPLCWPPGHRRRPLFERKIGKFTTMERRGANSWKSAEPVTLEQARRRLVEELDRIGAKSVILSTNVPVRQDGWPISGRRDPDDPAVALYFQFRGTPVAMPCDTYTQVAQNVAALAAHIEATRAIERHGVASLAAMFTGFMAIRGPGPKPWREVLGFPTDAHLTRTDIEAKRRELARRHHPDAGGTETAMAEINAAADAALHEIG